MVLNYIWIAFFLISLVVGMVRLIFFQDTEIFTTMVNSTFEMAGVAVEICLGLIGCLFELLVRRSLLDGDVAIAVCERCFGRSD